MTYFKPKDITYTQMCIYIDNNVYNESFDENLIYEYLYHIILMLARQKKYFRNSYTYDTFGLYSATKLYMRLVDDRQFTDPPELPKIKSILNYSKTLLYPLKVQFEQEHYYQISDPREDVDTVLSNYEFETKLNETLEEINRVEFNLYLNDISKTIKDYLQNIPYKSDKMLWRNIYLSCLLTFLNKITLENTTKDYIKELKRGPEQQFKTIRRFYSQERLNPVILYNLSCDMKDYIFVLVNELSHIICKDLSYSVQNQISNNVNIRNLLISCVDSQEEQS